MARLIRTPQANEDLISIWDYVAQDNMSAADKLLRQLDETCQLIATQPGMGERQDNYRPGLRGFVVGNYIIFYHEIQDGIEVFRILHGARRLEELL